MLGGAVRLEESIVRRAMIGLVLAGLMLAVAASAQSAGDQVERRWTGAWVLTRVDLVSDCGGTYTNNPVLGQKASGRGRYRFSAGELGKVDKVTIRSSRADLYITVYEPVLAARQDGPFTLYDERTCKIQLMIEIPRAVLRGRDAEPAQTAVDLVLSPYTTLAAAQMAEEWNGRERDPLPEDYEDTLARHGRWKAEQANARFATVRQQSLDEMTRVVDGLQDSSEYLAGFAAGAEALRTWRPSSCDGLAAARFESQEKRPSRERSGTDDAARRWQRGYRDGQRLAYHATVLREVERCFVPPPM
jgi:hypothetical protein